MIKLFRHIRKSLLMENKTGRYFKYAIGEIILVVIGILIALQINNWNEFKKAKAVEKVYLKQLLSDFNKNKEGIEYFKNAYDKQLKYLDVILRHTGPKVQVPSKVVFDSIQSLNTPNVELLYATSEAQTGLNLEFLSNNQIIQTIKQFPIVYQFYDGDETGLVELVLRQRQIHQQFIPLILRESRKNNQEHFKSDTLGFLRNREFQNITVDRLWVTRSAVYALKDVEKHNDSIVSLITKELEAYD